MKKDGRMELQKQAYEAYRAFAEDAGPHVSAIIDAYTSMKEQGLGRDFIIKMGHMCGMDTPDFFYMPSPVARTVIKFSIHDSMDPQNEIMAEFGRDGFTVACPGTYGGRMRFRFPYSGLTEEDFGHLEKLAEYPDRWGREDSRKTDAYLEDLAYKFSVLPDLFYSNERYIVQGMELAIKPYIEEQDKDKDIDLE
jgi:hypothetical protein